MIDPVSAFAIASSAYNAIKRGIEMGREIEDLGGQLGTWFGAVADVKAAEEEAKDPPLFKKLLYSGSVEQEAMANLMRRKKIEQQERELRELGEAHAGTQFTCITSTKVQILTPAALQSSLGARMSC